MAINWVAFSAFWGRSFISQLPLAITLGYIVADSIVMLHKFKFKDARPFLAHHFCTAVPYWFNITFGPLTYFAVFRLLAEFSTPFVNQRYFLDVLGKKSTLGYVINGVLLTIVFFVTRIAVIPPYYREVYYVLANRSTLQLNWLYLLVWVGGSVVLDVLNVWWFRKILRGAIKTIQLHKPVKEENGDTVRNRVKGE
ncbi:TLC domain-containing protein 4-B-like [Amphiura filiformis]|uniref:TLC domain-containing protein 4-B-like n=1 Tax=Amphiura filiformis TaxID=82378 RepID=UPI003B210C85